MKLSLRILAVLALSVSIVWLSGCKKSNPYSSTSLTKSSTAVMSATSSPKAANTTVADIPVSGGKLNVQTAWINIADLRIEENSGNDIEQQGGANDGDQGGVDNESLGGKEESGGIEDSLDAADITAAGPFSLDISGGQALIGSFDVYPGTFKKIDFTFRPNTNDPFYGKTMVISGEFTSDAGTVTPFTLKSEFSKQIQTQIAGGGITVAANSTVEVNVVFDLAGWFGNVDFSTAQTANGQILIDASDNAALLAAFEANLAKYVEVEEKK